MSATATEKPMVKPVNLTLLEGLDDTTFLGKVLTTTNEEIEDYFKKIPEPSKKEAGVGPIGVLTLLERALFTQAGISGQKTNELIDSLDALTESKEFMQMNPNEQIEKIESLKDEITGARRDATRYKKIAWAAVEKRHPEIAKDSYTVCNDGNIYKSADNEESEEYPKCPGCGKHHKPHGLIEVLEMVLGRG